MVPTFTQQSIGQGGAQLYPGSIATPTPQTFGVASPPLELDGFGVDDGPLLARHHALHTGPHPPGWSRLRDYGASSTGSLPVTPSGLARPARAVWQYQHVRPSSGPLATLPGAPRVGLPSGFTKPLRRPGGKVSHPPSITQRLVAHSSAAKKTDAAFKISFARRNSRTSARNFRRSADSWPVTPGRLPASISACRTHFRSVSADPIPSLLATATIAIHSDEYSARTSATISTARSRSSAG